MAWVRLLVLTLLLMLAVLKDTANADDEGRYRFHAFPGDVSRLTPLDLQARKAEHPSWIRRLNSWEAGYKWSSSDGGWTAARRVDEETGCGLIDWNLRSTGAVDLLARLLEEDLSGHPAYWYEEPFVEDCLARTNTPELDRAFTDLKDFLWRGARMHVRAPLVRKHIGLVDEWRRPRVLEMAEDAEDFGVAEYTLPWQRAWDSLTFVAVCDSARTLDRRIIPVVMLYLTHRDPPIRDAAAKTLSCLTYQVWIGDDQTPIEDRRIRFLEWWGKHKTDPLWRWYEMGMPESQFSKLAARAWFGDMQAVHDLAARLSRITLEEFRATEGLERVRAALGVSYTELKNQGCDLMKWSQPWRGAPEEEVTSWLESYRPAMQSLLKTFDPKESWVEWKLKQSEISGYVMCEYLLKTRTNHSFGMEPNMRSGGDNDGWQTRLDPVPPRTREALSEKFRRQKEVTRKGIAAAREWLKGEGKDWSFERQDALKIDDQLAYEKHLRRKFPQLFARLEDPTRRTATRLFDGDAYVLFDHVVRRECVARRQARVDVDGDKRGEFFKLWDGPGGYWEPRSLEVYALQREAGHPDVARCGRVLLRVFVPESTNEAEQHFACVAWPADGDPSAPGVAGLVLPDGRVFASPKGKFLGVDRVPELGDVFAAGQDWSAPRSDLWEETEWPTDYWR